MTSASTLSPSPGGYQTPPAARGAADAGPRLEIKPAGDPTGQVDGGWWPHSRRLADEVPGLVAALRDRLGQVESVSYHLGEWPAPPRRLDLDGARVRLAGYRLQREGSVDVIARNRRLTLLVVDPETGDDAARAALGAAADGDNTDDLDTLRAGSDRTPTTPTEA